VQSLQLRSVLCLPVIKQSRLIGVLYLENRLADGVFTSAKTQMTELLTSQAAISLENARLVEDMKEADEQMKKSLREKEVLLKEIHHRVKNNLQIVYSLINLQLPFVKDELAIDLFKESQNRVYSMALIHEKLYQSESLTRIDLGEYIQNLAANLLVSYGVSDKTPSLRISTDDIAFDIDTVIPCALIINELVSNSLKHAFPSSWKCCNHPSEIGISLSHAGERQFILTVSDNGIGLPQGFDIQKCESLGLQLVSVLVRQLRGDIRLNARDGTEFVISFEDKARKGR
jgi:two-component sensor histidine kinase